MVPGAPALREIWILQNYVLKNAQSKPAGYSIHCLDSKMREQFSQYVPSHDNAIMFAKSEDEEFIIAEKSKIKTIAVRERRELKITK